MKGVESMHTVKSTPLSKKSRASKLGAALYKNWQLYLFLLLPLAYLIVFKYIPMAGLQIAFRKYTPRQGLWDSQWVGWFQFNKFFGSYQFSRVLVNTLKLSFYSLLAGFPIPIIMALAMNSVRSTRYRSIIQNITYLPYFISTVVIVGILTQVFNTRVGMFSMLYRGITGASDVPDLLASASAFPHMYVWSGIWSETGWNTIIYMAALSAVDSQQHEAAVIDGASRFQRLIHVDFPAILPTITIMLILRCGQLMGIGFDKVYLMQNNLNLRASEVISTYVYKVGLSAEGGNDFSYATAIGFFNSVINLALLVCVNFISRKVSETSLW